MLGTTYTKQPIVSEYIDGYVHMQCFVSKRLHNVLIGSQLIVSLLGCVKPVGGGYTCMSI